MVAAADNSSRVTTPGTPGFLPLWAMQGLPRNPPWQAHWDYLFLGLLVLFNVMALMNSGTMADLNRDLAETLRILGGEWLTAGPAIAQRMHNGPVWFYTLSLPLWVSREWWLVTLWSGLLISSIWPLTYLLGRMLHGRRLGLAFTAALALPSWFSVYDYVYSHPALIPAATVATLVLTVLWWQRPGSWRLLLAALMGSVAMHAHFSTFGLLLFLLVLAVIQQWRDGFSVLALPAFLLGALIPWAPYLLEQGQGGFGEISSAMGYLGGFDLLANLRDLPATLFGYLIKGPWFALHFLSGWPVPVAGLFAALLVLLTVFGVSPWIRHSGDRGRGFWALGLLLALVFIGTTLIREFTPFYQILSLHVILAGLLATGWLLWMDQRHWLLLPVMALALILQLGEWRGISEDASEGVVFAPWSSLAILEQHPWGPMETRWWLAAKHRDVIAADICRGEADEVLLLGHLGAAVAVDGGVTVQMHCDAHRPRLWLQQGAGNLQLLAGISRHAARALGIDATDHDDGFYRLSRVRYQAVPEKPVPLAADYPPAFNITGVGARRQFMLQPDEILAVVNPLQSFITLPAPVVRWNRQVLQPVYSDGESHFYRCRVCTGDQPLTIEISPAVSDWVQVFSFPAAAQ